jgi:flavin-dependent dehydrogenase
VDREQLQALINDTFDVIVIGSGPAGVAAAISCVKAGLKTALFTNTKKRETKSALKPSESIHPGVESLLKKLDADKTIAASIRGTYDGITVNGEHTPLGADESGTWLGFHIDRNLFDSGLLEAARKQGVTIHEGTVLEILQENNRVTGITIPGRKYFYSKYIIDASGQKRIGGKKLKFKERFYSPPFVVWTGIAENLPSHFFNSVKTEFIPSENGWTWLAPELPDRCTWTRLSLKGEKEFHQPKLLDKFGLTQNVFTSNRRWRAFRPLVKEGIVLCGDAAGILDPAAGQGIVNALWSGMKAAECVSACISNSAMESFYLAQYDHWFINQYEEKAAKLKTYYNELGIRVFYKTK